MLSTEPVYQFALGYALGRGSSDPAAYAFATDYRTLHNAFTGWGRGTPDVTVFYGHYQMTPAR